VLEHGASQAPAVAQALVSAGYARVRCYADLAGHDRVTEAQWPSINRSIPMVRFETSHGAFTVELFEQEAPLSAANFLQYVDDGFYDGTIFHRIVPGFVIQGGGLTADFDQKKTRPPVKNEATNGELNARGTLSMARTDEINSATSQFFVNLTDNEFLDHRPGSYGYAVFGRIKEGMDVIDRIAKVKTGRRKHYTDAPMEDVVITSAKRVEAAK
jgi:peptidyl-prolyl cis-trans isomerase A (cyclophilin A)